MPKLLVVDNDARQRREIVYAARSVDFDKIEEADSEEAAYAAIHSGAEFQIAVIDVVLSRLPAKEGLVLIEALREAQPDCKIIALTAQGDTEFGAEALAAGAHDFVSTKWEYINWVSLLEQRLKMWFGLLERSAAVH
jgi:two-component system, chemotaxis family, chemotaxis protein CheY